MIDANPGAECSELAPEAQSIVGSDNAERIQAVRKGTWIRYPRATRVLEHLRYVLEQPPSGRMTGLTLVGPTSNGKTTIIRRFISMHRIQPPDPNAERPEFLYVETPAVVTPGMLYSQILRGAGDLKADKGTTGQRFARLLHILPQLKPRMMFLDEVHNVMAGSARQSESLLNALKSVSNQLQLPLVLVGTEAARNVIRTDAQVLSRYPPVELLPWGCDEQFSRLVSTVLSTFPLRRHSRLSATTVKHLHKRTAGAIGEVVQILQHAAVWAIETGAEEINTRALEATEVV